MIERAGEIINPPIIQRPFCPPRPEVLGYALKSFLTPALPGSVVLRSIFKTSSKHSPSPKRALSPKGLSIVFIPSSLTVHGGAGVYKPKLLNDDLIITNFNHSGALNQIVPQFYTGYILISANNPHIQKIIDKWVELKRTR